MKIKNNMKKKKAMTLSEVKKGEVFFFNSEPNIFCQMTNEKSTYIYLDDGVIIHNSLEENEPVTVVSAYLVVEGEK